ncbi:hypothetical protein ES707_11020 [subsurface metagenome]
MLLEFEEKAVTQEAKVLFFFRQNLHRSFTPFEVKQHSGLNAPITSIRRAMSNLTDQGRLIKTPATRQGEYGKPNYCWRLL